MEAVKNRRFFFRLDKYKLQLAKTKLTVVHRHAMLKFAEKLYAIHIYREKGNYKRLFNINLLITPCKVFFFNHFQSSIFFILKICRQLEAIFIQKRTEILLFIDFLARLPLKYILHRIDSNNTIDFLFQTN